MSTSRKIRRINIWGGPSTGKSTVAAGLFSQLKVKGLSVELVPEYIKQWAYEGKQPKSFDRVFLCANQMHSENRLLPYVDLIVSDSPLLLIGAYGGGVAYLQSLIDLAKAFEEQYPSLNFFLTRKFEYKKEGRFQEATEVTDLDKLIWQTMKDHCPADRTYYGVESIEDIGTIVESAIKEK